MATYELKLPKLGESVTEGTLGKWLKKPGDKVEKYELLVEVQTDKVSTEIPSPVSGTLKDVKVQEGETVPNNTVIAVLDVTDAAAAEASRPSSPGARPAAAAAAAPRTERRRRADASGADGRAAGGGGGRINSRDAGRPSPRGRARDRACRAPRHGAQRPRHAAGRQGGHRGRPR